MKRTLVIVFLTIFINISFSLFAQEKYAVLFCGATPIKDDTMEDECWHIANPNPPDDPYDEFWNDIYLFWELLIEQGYDNDNIYVLFGEGGYDWPREDDTDIAWRYTPWEEHSNIIGPDENISDFGADAASLVIVLSGLAIGNPFLGIPQLTVNDFLLIWAFGHGEQIASGHTELKTLSGAISDQDFANYVNAINCDKKVVLFAQCFGGGFVPYYNSQNSVYALSATSATMIASGTDKFYYDEIDEPGDTEPGNLFNAYERDIWTTPNLINFEHDHSEFNLHILNSIRGKTPANETYYSVTGLPNFNLSTADVNNDNIITMTEAFDWNWNYNSAFYPSLSGQYDDPQEHDPVIGYKTSLKYPNLINIDIDASGAQNGIIGITKQVHVLSGSTLTFNNAIVNLDYDGELVVDAGGTLEIENNVTIKSISGTRKIIVNGNLTVGSNVSFLAEEGAEIRLEINNTSLTATINSATFQRGILQSNQNSLTLNNCNFNDGGGVIFSLGNLTASGCHFDGASLHATNGSTGKCVTITNQCQFTNAGYGVYLLSYPNFFIQHSTFISNSTGIGLYQSGTGSGRQLLNNTITSNGTGVLVYNSLATLTSKNLVNKGNRIYNNYVGLQSYNNSQVSLIGYAMATSWNATQYITDNAHYEVYATQGSFPVPFRNNAVFDEDNTEPMLYYTGQLSESLDVRNNYWGVNFNSQSDFYPWQIYNYIPVWIPGGGGGGSGAGAEALYLAARENIETEEYAEAKEELEQIVDEYPETEFAKAAMKELYAIEEYSGDNYTALKDYFNSNSVIQGDSSLIKLANFLANFCEIKLENWPTAIAWFEDVIQEPETFEDSIFAIIDLGYTYWLMENGGLKSTYTGTMPQYKFASQKAYEENRDYLLSLLPGDGLSETMKQSLSTLKTGELLQNVPNPFNGTTQIWFKLAEESTVTVTVYDYTGKEVSVINPGLLEKGNHTIEFNSANLSSGIYFYSLEVNGIKTDTKKMTLIK